MRGTANSGEPVEPTFVALEGIDGIGKTTVARHLAPMIWPGRDLLAIEKNAPAPEDARLAQRFRRLGDLVWNYSPEEAIGGVADRHWALLQATWFALLDEAVIRPALRRGAVTMIDGWTGKLRARARVASDPDPAWVDGLFAGLATPLIVLLDADPRDLTRRRSEFSPSERGVFAGMDDYVTYQDAVRAKYRTLAAAEGWVVVTVAGQSEQGLAEDIVRIVQGSTVPAIGTG